MKNIHLQISLRQVGSSCSLKERIGRFVMKKAEKCRFGIRPGDRGKDRRSWSVCPLTSLVDAMAYFTSPSGSGRADSEKHELKGLRGEARSATALSRVRSVGKLRPSDRYSYPEGYGCYCKPARISDPGETTSPKGPCKNAGRENGIENRGAGELGKVRKTSNLGRSEKPDHPTASYQSNLRVKRSDP